MADIAANRVVPQDKTITDMAAGTWQTLHIQGDATATAGWANRWEAYYTPNGGTERLVAWFNEFGEFRVIPSATSRVGLRVFAAVDSTELASRSATTPVLEVTDQRDGTRTTLFGVYGDGSTTMFGRKFTAGTSEPGSPSTGALHLLTTT